MAEKEALKLKFATGEKPTGADFAELIDGVVGPEGPKGATGTKGGDGAKGEQGIPGTAGKDGFGTEVQYNEIITRLEALESPGG